MKRLRILKLINELPAFARAVLVEHERGDVFYVGIERVSERDHLHDGREQHEEQREWIAQDDQEFLIKNGGEATKGCFHLDGLVAESFDFKPCAPSPYTRRRSASAGVMTFARTSISVPNNSRQRTCTLCAGLPALSSSNEGRKMSTTRCSARIISSWFGWPVLSRTSLKARRSFSSRRLILETRMSIGCGNVNVTCRRSHLNARTNQSGLAVNAALVQGST